MKTNMQSIEDLLSIDYESSIIKKGKGYVARIRDLNISANGKSIEAAIQKLDKKKRAFFEDMVVNDTLDNIPEPGQFLSRMAGRPPMSDTYSAIRNMVLIVVGIAAITWFGAPVITDRIIDRVEIGASVIADRMSHNVINSINNRLSETLPDGRSFRKGIRQTLSEVAANVKLLTPEVRDKLLSDVRTIVTAVKPFLNETKPLYCPPQVVIGNNG